jgi:hypothetical protein
VAAHSSMPLFEIGGSKTASGRVVVGLSFLSLSLASFALAVSVIVLSDAWGLLVIAVVFSAFFGNSASKILVPRVAADDLGVRWRKSPWNSGIIAWCDIADVTTHARHTEMGGGMNLPAAQLVLKDGRSVEIARGTLFQRWDRGEMVALAQFVRDWLMSGDQAP